MARRSWAAAALVCVALVAFTGPTAAAQEAYRLGPRDVVSVSVFGHQELTGRFPVGDEGSITFPLLGAVPAGGLTVTELQASLVRGLSDGFLRSPQVSVDIVQYMSQRVYAIGEVRTPGAITLTGTASLLDLLVKAGSLTEQAGGEIRVLRRRGANATGPLAPGQPDVDEIARISVQQVRRGLISFNGTLLDGDTIFVPRAETVFVLGNVNKPGTYLVDPGVTTVLTAIAQAGGVSELGSTKRVRVSRIVNGQNVEFDAKLDDLLQPGDTVVVGLRRF
ncbi:MAG: polysaccharide biosynthesis/export family protein [Vicinamibacterales bacterium]